MGEKRICIRDLNPHIVCILCAGYFIDATTITECLHTFCKSCVVKYLQTSKHCPMCNVKIHDTQPLLNLKPDRVMQEIVYKLVPNLMENEEVRKAEFEKTRGMNHSLKSDETSVKEYNGNFNLVLDGMHSYLYDEQISLCLEPVSLCTKEGTDGTSYYGCVKRKYVRCSVRTQISHIKRLIPRLWPCYEGELIEVLCQDEELDDCCCLKYTWLTKWVNKVTPMTLRFRSKYPETPSYALNLVTLQELSDRSNQH